MTISGLKNNWLFMDIKNSFKRFSEKKVFHGNLSKIFRNLIGITNALFPNDPF
jgi:hypothetical protein